MGLCLSSQTWGTQDKRSQSKGDVEVMKTKALRGRELLGAAVILSTSDPLPPSSTARRINRPRLYGNLTPHEHKKTHTSLPLSFTSSGSEKKQDHLSATCDFLGSDTAFARWAADDRPPPWVNTPDGCGRARIERLTPLTRCLSLLNGRKSHRRNNLHASKICVSLINSWLEGMISSSLDPASAVGCCSP